MEMKNILPSKPITMILHQLKEKKSWTLLTLLIVTITVVVLPMLMEMDISEEYIILGLIEVIAVVLINCLIDFSYLHDSRKYGYYLSKPISNVQRLNMNLVVNIIFASMFIVLLYTIAVFNNLMITELFLMPIAWLFVLMFLVGFSSYLSGNTIIAAIATVFNFTLPLFILGVAYFAMAVVGDIAIGYNAEIILEYIVENIYRLDIMYFEYFIDSKNLIAYFALLIGICSAIYVATRFVIKRRENERIGEHLVFNGYKYFVALMMSTLFPFIFANSIDNNSYITKLISFVILGSITYYVALVILEKSFRLKKSAYKLLIVFMIVFMGLVSGMGMAVKSTEKDVPNVEDIKEIYISDNSWIYIEELDRGFQIYNLEYGKIMKYGIFLYESNESIEAITDLHKSIVNNPNYNRNIQLNIIYFLKDGSRINKYFELGSTDDKRNESLDQIAKNLELSEEYKNYTMPFLFDSSYEKEINRITINYDNFKTQKRIVLEKESFNEFLETYKTDIEYMIENDENSFTNLSFRSKEFNFWNRSLEPKSDKKEELYISFEMNFEDNSISTFQIPVYFTNTMNLIENYTNND